jgi:hypothetical protein
MLPGFGVADAEPAICEGCGGDGIRAPASPSCVIPGIDFSEWVVVEKCDTCQRYQDDFAAACAVFEVVKWVKCSAGGWHAVGMKRRGEPDQLDSEQADEGDSRSVSGAQRQLYLAHDSAAMERSSTLMT